MRTKPGSRRASTLRIGLEIPQARHTPASRPLVDGPSRSARTPHGKSVVVKATAATVNTRVRAVCCGGHWLGAARPSVLLLQSDE
eukprot:scaffold2599_cov74-Phaeocystis_antarctica.AAC.7